MAFHHFSCFFFFLGGGSIALGTNRSHPIVMAMICILVLCFMNSLGRILISLETDLHFIWILLHQEMQIGLVCVILEEKLEGKKVSLLLQNMESRELRRLGNSRSCQWLCQKFYYGV